MNVLYRIAPDGAQREGEAPLRPPRLSSVPSQDRPYLGLACLCADAGRPERARQLIAEYETAVPQGVRRGEPFPHGAAGQIPLARGRIPGAIRGYRARYERSRWAVGGVFLPGRADERARARGSALAAY